MRTLVERTVLGLIALVACGTWIARPLEVVGGSMAPTLRGAHQWARCPHCGHTEAIGIDGVARPMQPGTCYQCWGALEQVGPLRSGDRLLVLRGTLAWRPPRRFEIVVLRHPDRAGELIVKRVVGLPGETITLADGDLWRHDPRAPEQPWGRSARIEKTLDEFFATAVLVADAERQLRGVAVENRSFQPTPDGRPSHAAAGGFILRPDASAPEHTAGVAFQVRRPRGGTAGPWPTGLLDDRLAYNQRWPVAAPQTASDFVFAAAVGLGAEGRVAWQFMSPGSRHSGEVARRDLVARGTLPSTGSDVSPASTGSGELASTRFVAGWVDGRVRVEVDGPAVAPACRSHVDPEAVAGRVGLAVRGGRVEIRGLRVWRDIHYLPPPLTRGTRPDGSWTASLGPDEYLVLGDNPAVSEDSRDFAAGPGVPAHLIYGKVLGPLRWPTGWGW